jgi:hypothetical protein
MTASAISGWPLAHLPNPGIGTGIMKRTGTQSMPPQGVTAYAGVLGKLYRRMC